MARVNHTNSYSLELSSHEFKLLRYAFLGKGTHLLGETTKLHDDICRQLASQAENKLHEYQEMLSRNTKRDGS